MAQKAKKRIRNSNTSIDVVLTSADPRLIITPTPTPTSTAFEDSKKEKINSSSKCDWIIDRKGNDTKGGRIGCNELKNSSTGTLGKVGTYNNEVIE